LGLSFQTLRSCHCRGRITVRCKNVLFPIVLFTLLFTFPGALMAQELTQTFTSADGMFTMSYPDGWTVEEEDGRLFRFSSDQAFLQVDYADYGEEVTPLSILEISAAEHYGFSPPENLTVAGYGALRASSEDQLHVLLNFCGGIMSLAIGFVQPGDMPTYEPTFMAMLETIQYGEGEPVDCRGPFESLQRITSANASQVAQLTTFGDETVPVASVAFSPDGGAFAAADLDGGVRIWSTLTGEELVTLTGHRDGATSVAFGSGGHNLAVGTGSGQVRMWDATSGFGYGTMQEHSTAVESVAFTPEGFLLASSALDGEVRLVDIVMGDEGAVLVDSDNLTPVESVAFSPDETLLAAGGGNTIRIWDVASATVQAVLETEISEIDTVSFSPDGTMLVYGGADPAVWVWNLADDNHVLLEGNVDQVFALAFSPDGQTIVTADAGAVRLWDAATGANLVELASPSGEAVNSIAFSPTGTLIASASDSGGVVLWGTAEAGGQEAAASESTGETGSTGETTTSGSTCTITAPSNANLRSGPGTDFERAGSLSAGQSVDVDGQATGSDGMTWYRLTDGTWARSDVVNAPAECGAVSVVTP
jgi:WD40 repeat protein